MKADTATLADVKLVLTAPLHIQTKRSGYSKAQVDFVSARMKVIDHLGNDLIAPAPRAVSRAGIRCRDRLGGLCATTIRRRDRGTSFRTVRGRLHEENLSSQSA
jgi:hypothetical protein